MNAFREEPFLLRVGVLVAATTATALVIDYYFKSTIAHNAVEIGGQSQSADGGPFLWTRQARTRALHQLQRRDTAVLDRLGYFDRKPTKK